MAGEKDSASSEGLRKRKGVEKEPKHENETPKSSSTPKDQRSDMTSTEKLENDSYWLTRILLLRYLGFIYC